MTLNELVTEVKTNLGNRVSGTIGGQSVDITIINGISSAMLFMISKYNPLYYNRTATLSLTTATRTYTLPTEDSMGRTIRIKDVKQFRCYRADGTDIQLVHMNYGEFVKNTPNFSLNYQGTPCYFAVWEGQLILDYIPSEEYTLAMYVECYPQELTVADANFQLPINPEWALAIECYATSHVYAKLQQVQMSQLWAAKYKEQLGTLPDIANRLQMHNVNSMGHTLSITDPVNNPFVGSWN